MLFVRRNAAVAPLVVLTFACLNDNPVAPRSTIATLPALAVSSEDGPRRHIVVLKAERAPTAAFLSAVQALGARIEQRRDAIGVVTLTGLTDAGAATLATRTDVEGAALDQSVQWLPPAETFMEARTLDVVAQTDQSGAFFFADQWNMRQINADKAWLVTNQGAGATIAILDTGVDPGQLDLNGKVDLARSKSVLTAGSSPCNRILGLQDEETITDFNAHGTFTSAIASSNGIGTASVAPDATILTVKVLNCVGSGSFNDIIAGIEYAAAQGVDVINMSLGALLPKSNPNTKTLVIAVQRAILKAVAKGVIVVAAAGNEAVNLDVADVIAVPAQLLGVVSVSATAPVNQQNFDAFASYSNFGRLGVDVAAPGGDFVTGGVVEDLILGPCSRFQVTLPFSCASGLTYIFGSGTSLSSPHVAGEAAVIESETRGNSFGLLLETCVFRGTDHPDNTLFSPQYGWGRIDVLEAVKEFGCSARRYTS
jgi:subtilisin family serine protease